MTIQYYPINEELARRANDMNSYFDYKEGSATAEYKRSVDAAAKIAEEQKRKVDPIHHERIDRLLDTYARRLADNINKRNVCRPSWSPEAVIFPFGRRRSRTGPMRRPWRSGGRSRAS